MRLGLNWQLMGGKQNSSNSSTAIICSCHVWLWPALHVYIKANLVLLLQLA
jgi:hypothetical protein